MDAERRDLLKGKKFGYVFKFNDDLTVTSNSGKFEHAIHEICYTELDFLKKIMVSPITIAKS